MLERDVTGIAPACTRVEIIGTDVAQRAGHPRRRAQCALGRVFKVGRTREAMGSVRRMWAAVCYEQRNVRPRHSETLGPRP